MSTSAARRAVFPSPAREMQAWGASVRKSRLSHIGIRCWPSWCAPLLLALAGVLGISESGAADPLTPEPRSASAGDLYHWFSLPIAVAGLPPGAADVPVSSAIDFSDVLEKLRVPGAVDERSLRFVEVLPTGQTVERPVQFLPNPQPRPLSRRVLPDSNPQASFVAEYRVAESPEIRVAGELTWMASADAAGGAHYRLVFGVPREGRAVQVPYPPQNLRFFTPDGRATPLRYFPRMQIRPQWPLNGAIRVSDAGAPVTEYHTGPTSDTGDWPFCRPFFYPVLDPRGRPLTELGKAHDPTGSHRHHYSLWIAHHDVAGRDFWSDAGGRIVHEGFDLLEDGPVFCRIVQRARWVFQGETQLRERRTITLYAATDQHRLVDFEMEYSPPTANPVTLGQTTFGLLALRVAQAMSVFDGGGEIRTSAGLLNESQVHRTHADWLDQSGPVAAGAWSGAAVFDHPSNVNHPTGWHCRNDGWACASLTMDGPLDVTAERHLAVRYRLDLHCGDAAEAGVAARYAEYAAAVTVELGEAAPVTDREEAER